MKEPLRVAVTGAAGQIGYALVFRIAAGEMLGKDQPIVLQLLEIPPAMDALGGVVMELNDCAFPLLQDVVQTDQPDEAFNGTHVAMLVGSRPRGPGMERSELLEANGAIFTVQGKALNDGAARNVKVLVVGNPANTNCLIAQKNAPDLDASQFSAMTKLDHNRAVGQLAAKTGANVEDIAGLAIWGNHSPTMYPDLNNTTVKGTAAMELVDKAWVEDNFIPSIQQRGAEIIAARGSSSAASAANAAVEAVRAWHFGSEAVTSMAIVSAGQYDITPGLVFSYPVLCHDGTYDVVGDQQIDDFARQKLAATEAELIEERDAIAHLL